MTFKATLHACKIKIFLPKIVDAILNLNAQVISAICSYGWLHFLNVKTDRNVCN